jgi:predicted component of type VI protein secretion system
MIKNLTFSKLKKIVLEEKKKLQKKGIISTDSVQTVEDAWSGGDNLVKHVDFIKQLEITETKLRVKADKLSRARDILKKKIVRDL